MINHEVKMSTIEHVESGLPVKTGDAHPLPVTGVGASIIADNGVALPIASLAHTFMYLTNHRTGPRHTR